jgi:hypothetical protein
VEEQFASHQDIRSQLNKIMKVGILSHSDDPMVAQKEEEEEADDNIPLPHIPDEVIL